jgi:hypothetical protein
MADSNSNDEDLREATGAFLSENESTDDVQNKTTKKTFFAFSLVLHIFGRGRFDPLNRNWGSLNPSNQTFSEST